MFDIPSLLLVKGWTQAQFVNAMRTGILPDGDALEEVMPWRTIARMDDVDLAAMYVTLHNMTVPQK